jgi:hypothetical protein
MTEKIGFFSGFNARHLGAEQVARTFVPNKKFIQLLAIQNSLLVGPRGSGKTHMLKMLQPRALNAWTHGDADSIRSTITYWGVFVPADEAWRQQIEFAGESLAKNEQAQFRLAVFTTHVQRSFIDCCLQLTHEPADGPRAYAYTPLSTALEGEVCRDIANSWKLTPRIHSLLGLRQALVDRAADLYECVDFPERLSSVLTVCQTQCVQAVLRAANAFDSAVERHDGRWCLMFDELEIAPPEVQSLLFRSLRSTDQKLIFKLALSPSTEAANVFQKDAGPSSGNDFEEISLYSDFKESALFCAALWEQLSTGTSSEHLTPISVLRHSPFHEPDSVRPYGPGGRWHEASKRLARKDRSYVELLAKYGLDPRRLNAAPADLKNSVVRKIGPLVGFRDFMLKPVTGGDGVYGTIVRSDKSRPAQLYNGWEVLCLVTEGNPRWFTGIVKNLLLHRQSTASAKELSPEVQYRVLLEASKKFMDYVATIPSTANIDGSGEGGLKALMNKLVAAFRQEVLIKPFSLDPVLSFQVDDSISQGTQQAIFDGLYAGAFIPVSEEDRQFAFSRKLAGQRLRLTYLISPSEFLPLRTGKDRKLSTLLKGKNSKIGSQRISKKTEIVQDFKQASLFNE